MKLEKIKLILDKNIRWLKWVAIAACLCLVVAAGIIVPKLIDPAQDDSTPPFVVDAAPMVYINDTLYKDSAVEISYTKLNEDAYLGEIEREVTNVQRISNGLPDKNFQANHSIVGSKVYQYGDDIIVEINGKYWLYENYTDERKTVNFHGKLFDKSELSKETLEWLQWYNSLSPEEQLAVSYEPYELRANDNSSYTTDAESSTVQELDVDYATNDDGTYTCRDNIYKYKIEVSGIDGKAQVTFIVLTNDTKISFEEVSYSLKKAEMSTGVPEFVILGWY